MILLGLGFWLSTWHVFRVHGDRRAALNLSFEWTAIVAACCLAVRLIRKRSDLQLVVNLLVTLGIGLSAMGIVQHHVTYVHRAVWYQQQVGHASFSELQRIGVPTDGPGRALFEGRLLDSTEPVGTFALANTLGGVLAVVLVLLAAAMIETFRSVDRRNILCWIVVATYSGVVGYCLLLTKSRTAWVGCALGVGVLFLQQRRSLSVWLRLFVFGGTCIAVISSVGLVTGAIDKEVLLEAPKSLQYRLFYWVGATGVISESPVWGSGPGNFRQAYLAHKVAESSEEILDPHNLFFDAWCSGGLIGFVGICLLSVFLLRNMFRPSGGSGGADATNVRVRRLTGRPVIVAILSATMVFLGWRWFSGGPFWDFVSEDFFLSENLLLLIPTVACVSVLLVDRFVYVPSTAIRAAASCLLVHLLGAGGLQISVLGTLLFVLYTLSSFRWDLPEKTINSVTSYNLPRVAAAFCCVAGILAIAFGVLPVLRSESAVALAEFRLSQGDRSAADLAFDEAIAADQLSVRLRQRKVEQMAYEFMKTAGRYAQNSESPDVLRNGLYDEFRSAVDACDDLIEADRRGVLGYVYRGQITAIMSRATADFAMLNDAVDDLRHVVDTYPTNASHQTSLALLYDEVGNKNLAVGFATSALQQDELNRSWGHADRYLDGDLVAKLKDIVDGNSNSRQQL